MNTRWHKRLFAQPVGATLLAFCAFAEATTDISFWESPVNSKLNSIEVSEIAQDGSGALWFATQEGLTRQRGEDVDIFTAANADDGGLKPGGVKALAVSSAGKLWVLTRSLQVFNPGTQKFETPITFVSEGESNSIAFDSQDRLWIGLKDSIGLYRPGLGRAELFELPEPNIREQGNRIRATPIVKLIPLGNKMIGINSEAVYEFSITDTGEVRIAERAKLSAINKPVITTSAAIHGENVFIGTISSGLFVVNLERDSVRACN